MKTKEKRKNQVRMQYHRTFKVFGVVVLTVAALVLTSIIGPNSRNDRVRADNLYSQLNIASPTGGTYTTRTLQTNPYAVDPGTVPGTISLARYVPPGTITVGATEHGYRGSVDPCTSLYALDNTQNGGNVVGNLPCSTTVVADSALGDQTGLTGTAALDHRWIQGEDSHALVYQLPGPSNNAIVFPSIDHAVGIYEAVEYTVWGLPAGTPLQAFTPAAPWVEGRLVKFYKDGWSAHASGTSYCQSFMGDDHETDDYASVWSFRDGSGALVSVSFVAILAGQSLHITPEPPVASTQDNTNCFFEQINATAGSGVYTSEDCEIDAVGISTGVTGCIGDECLPPPPPPSINFCSYTQGKFNDKAKNPVASYVQNNFSALFPSGLTIGVDDGNGPQHHATWTNVNNLRVYIGGGGTAGALIMDASNPTARSQTGGGVLASQVLALSLNIRLSGSGGGQPAGFGSLILCNTGNASLNGKTVQDILNQANLFLGGSPSYNLGLNASALSSLIDNLNRSWDDCMQSAFAQSYICLPQQP